MKDEIRYWLTEPDRIAFLVIALAILIVGGIEVPA